MSGLKETIARLAGMLALAGLGLAGCTDHPQVSTEVENEIAPRVLQGVAMDSAALDAAEWSAWDCSGSLVAQGMTDSVGHFASSLPRAPVGGMLVRVVRGGDTLRALVGLDTSVVRDRVATVIVSPLTQAALPLEMGAPSEGFLDKVPGEVARRGQYILDSVLGVSLPWRELASDPSFRAFAPLAGGLPSPMSGFLRAISTRAARDGIGGPQWIADQEALLLPFLAQDSLFGVDLVAALAVLRLPQANTVVFVQRLDVAAANPSGWENTWRFQQIIPDPQDLEVRVPWASLPANLPVWERLVRATGDQAADYENHLPPLVRKLVKPGRSHEILAEAVGELIVPDSFSNQSVARIALDTLLARVVPQALLLLDQVRPEVWGMPPPPPVPDSGKVAVAKKDPLPQLLALGLKSRLAADWNYRIYEGQSNPSAWLNARFLDFAGPQAASDTLKIQLKAHPELTLPPDPFR